MRFEKTFYKTLNEAVPGEEPERGSEQAELGTDPNTPDGTFDDVPDNPMAQAKGQEVADTVGTLTSWISQIQSFKQLLNGVEPGSMNHKLNTVDCDSILADVARSESKKISRIAQDMSGLEEALKQYLLAAQQKQTQSGQI